MKLCMTKFLWSIWGFLALCVGFLLNQSPEALYANGLTTNAKSLRATSEAVLTAGLLNSKFATEVQFVTMERDQLYHDLLRAFERLKAVWKQQPGNILALQRSLGELQSQITELRQSLHNTGPVVTRPPAGKAPAAESEVKAPAGPVQPSKKPSSDENIKKRMEATLKRFLSAGPLDENALEARTLVGVPETWIVKHCDFLEEELTRMARLLEADSPDSNAIQNSLAQLQEILYRMGKPRGTSGPPDA
jgi:hypothetical protein